jgi:DUF4097 and DUF4098 domain-containing protein YvlB
MKTNRFMLACIAAGFFSVAHAATPVDETRSMPADGRVQVDNMVGSIEITGWDRSEVSIRGELGDGVEELEISESSQGVTVRVRNRKNRRFVEETRLRLQVPVAASVIAEGVSADIKASGLQGGNLVFNTVSGDIRADARTPRVEIESVSGDVTFRGQASRASVETVSGEIDLQGIEGEVRIATVSGGVELAGSGIAIARFETVSGDVELRLDVADSGRLNADSMSGDVTIVLPSGQQGDFSAQTYSGRIRSDFGTVDEASRGPGRKLDHREGAGGAIIRVESFSGDIRITRR